MAVKKISEFPVVEAIGVHVFGRKDNKNVQTILDIKQSIGVTGSDTPPSSTSLVSEAAVSQAIGVLENKIKNINNKTGSNIFIGVDINDNIDLNNPTKIVEKSDTIGTAIQKVVDHLNSVSVGAAVGIISPNKTLSIGIDSNTNNTTIDVKIDEREGNRIKLTSTGALRVESENFWKQL